MTVNNVKRQKYGIRESFIERIQNAIDMGLKTQVKKLVPDLHPADQADLIYNLDHDQRLSLIEILGNKLEAEVLVELDGEVREEIIGYLDKEHLSKALSDLDTDDAVDIIEEMGDDLTNETLDSIKSSRKREAIEESLSYPEDSVGRLMVPKQYAAVPKDWSVNEVIKYIRSNRKLPEDFSEVVVVDEYFRPVSIISVSYILKSAGDKIISQIMEDPEDLKILRADMDQSEAANLFKKYGLKLSPVVDDGGLLIGTISSNEIIEVIDEEAEEDMLLMGNVNEADMHASVFTAAKGRFPWLMTSLATTAVSSFIIGMFSDTIEKVVVLAALMPIIAALAGVGGNQTLTVFVRNLAIGAISSRNVGKTILKEVLMGFFNGLIVATCAGVAVYVWKQDLMLCFVFGVAIVFALTLSGLIATVVPWTVSKLKLDPAITSGAFITTTLDALAFLVFLKMATLFIL